MNYKYYIIIVCSITLIIWGSFYYTKIYSYQQPASFQEKEQFNTLTSISDTESNSWTASYVLPNGLILFDTSVPEQRDFDYISDDSITKFVSAKVPLNNKQYTPVDLVPLQSEYLIITNPTMQLRAIALKKLNELATEFYTIFKDKIVIVSAYRSYKYQKNLEKWCSVTLCARAWYSEHQLWLTIDIFAATTAGNFLSKADFKKYYERLMQNAHRYGRHNSYQRWVSTDTYQQEPRHWRYVWRELATELYNNQQTFAEWYNEQQEEISTQTKKPAIQ